MRGSGPLWMKDDLGSSGLSGSEVGFAVLQRFGLTSRIQGPGSSIREWAAEGEDYGRKSSPTQMPCEIQVEQPYTWHALLGWQQRKGGRCSAVALSAAMIGVQQGLGLFWSLLGAGTQAMIWAPSMGRGVQGQGCSCPLPCFLDGAHGTQSTVNLNVSGDASLPPRFVSKGGLAGGC